MSTVTARRAALAAIAACVVAPLVRAQDPRSAAAQDEARDWLVLVDRFDIEASYNAAGPLFREALKPAVWAEAVRKVREPLGAVLQRTAAKTTFAERVPGQPPGSYALIAFRTSFANRSAAAELVTLAVDGYRWRVVGYTIRQ